MFIATFIYLLNYSTVDFIDASRRELHGSNWGCP